MPRKPTVYNAKWRRARKLALDRDGWICQINGPNCLGRATEGDHIVPVEAGGALYDLANIRAACLPCNHGRHSRMRQRRSRPSREW